MAIILSVTFVLVFGEIIPSAIFTGANQLRFAAALTPLVWTCMILFFPIAYPIAKLLDIMLGQEEDDMMHRGEIKVSTTTTKKNGERGEERERRRKRKRRNPSYIMCVVHVVLALRRCRT